jgi:hypothetical protein
MMTYSRKMNHSKFWDMDLTIYSLKSTDEIEILRQRAGADRFDAFKEKTYAVLKKLQPGEQFLIEESVSLRNQPVFLKLACLYILETGWDCNIDIVGKESNVIRGVLTPNEHLAQRMEYFRRREQRRAL